MEQWHQNKLKFPETWKTYVAHQNSYSSGRTHCDYQPILQLEVLETTQPQPQSTEQLSRDGVKQ